MLGSGVILALLSIKLNQPAGRTKNPVLHPSVSQGLLFPQVPGKIFPGCFFPPLILFSAHSPNQKTSPRATQPCKEGLSESPGWWEKGERGQNDACVSLWGIVLAVGRGWENKQTLCVTQGSPDRALVTQSKAGHCLELLAVFVGLQPAPAPQTICPCLCHSGMRTSGIPVNGAQESSKAATFHSSVEVQALPAQQLLFPSLLL